MTDWLTAFIEPVCGWIPDFVKRVREQQLALQGVTAFPLPASPLYWDGQTMSQEQLLGAFLKPWNQVKISLPALSTPTLPLCTQQCALFLPICPLPHCPWLPQGRRELQSPSCPAPAGLHRMPSSGTDSSNSCGVQVALHLTCSQSNREHLKGLGREGEVNHRYCCYCPQLSLALCAA